MLVPQVTNAIDPTVTAISQGIILVAVLFILPGGLVSLPRVIRRLMRKRDTSVAASPQTTPPIPQDAGPAAEGPETERQGQS